VWTCVVALVCVNTEDSAAHATTVVDLVCVNMEDGAADAKAVVDLLCVNMEDGAKYVVTALIPNASPGI